MKYSIFFKLFSIILILFAGDLKAQSDAEIIDLKKSLESEKDAFRKLELYCTLSRAYLQINIDSALMYANKGLYLAEQSDNSFGTAEIYASIGDIMVVKNYLSSARENYLKSILFYKQAGSIKEQAEVFLVLGNISFVQNNFPEALNYYFEGKNIADSLQLVNILPDFYNNIGSVYSQLEDFEMALEYFKTSQKLFKRIGELNQVPATMSNIISIQISLNNFDEAMKNAESALQLIDSINGSQYLKTDLYQGIGLIKYKTHDYESSIKFYRKSIESIESSSSDYLGPKSVNIAAALLNIGKCQLKLSKNNEARANLLETYKMALETGQLGVLADASKYLAILYEKIDNPEDALKYHKLFKKYADSVLSDQTLKKITQIRMQYEFNEKIEERELEQTRKEATQKRKELIYILVIGSIIMALLFTFLLYRLQTNRNKQIELKRKNLKLDLDHKNRELTTNVMYLMKKNEFIKHISMKLKKSRYDFKPENRIVIDSILNEIENIAKEVNWKDFELRFQNVHSEFYKKLNERVPDLSPNELKICAFLRLNMSTKEISSITFQSYNSIIMARHRLRKKLNIDTNENLITFLRQI